MRKRQLILLFIVLAGVFTSRAEELKISNARFEVSYETATNNFTITDKSAGVSKSMLARFAVLYHANAVAPKENSSEARANDGVSIAVPRWNDNADLFSAASGAKIVSTATGASLNGGIITMTFADNSKYNLTATLSMPDEGLPQLRYTLKAATGGNFSISFYGVPEVDASAIDELWQPMVWIEKRFPTNSYLTPSYLCAMPVAAVRHGGSTYGVIAEPSNFPFTPLPTWVRSEFGVAVRNDAGKAQPMLWSPIMGTTSSRLITNATTSFAVRLFVLSNSMSATHKYLADELYGFKKLDRHNVLGTLNQTFDRMLDYGMSEYSRFFDEWKACNYENDEPGAVKNTSALHPISLAFVTDNKEIYQKRALPMLEFLVSRQNYMFRYSNIPTDAPEREYSLGFPPKTNPHVATQPTELCGLYQMSGKKMDFLLEFAEQQKVSPAIANKATERFWRDRRALYKATDNVTYKTDAVTGADKYVQERIEALATTPFLDNSDSPFWEYLAPKYVDLLEMYEMTKDEKYLDAAYDAALRFARFLWFAPAVPDSNITVNKGNKAPIQKKSANYSKDAISVPEESVPAWRLSEIGLRSEASATALSHRAIFMAQHAPFFLRLAAYKNDDFLRRIAKFSVIGRYTTFPGYHINTDRTTVYEKENFPNRPHRELNSTSMHYNHPWVMVSLLLDYMVNEAYDRSGRAIDFPYEFVEAFAQLQGHVYAQQKGKFYTYNDALLWMPKALLTTSDPELNYIAARGDKRLYLVFTNQSSGHATSTIAFNPDVLAKAYAKDYDVQVWKDNVLQPSKISMSNGEFTVSVSPNGITAVCIEGIEVFANFQNTLIENEMQSRWSASHVELSDSSQAHSLLIDMGKGLTNMFVYSAAPKGKLRNLSITYSLDNGDPVTLTDEVYPFEFSIPIDEQASAISYSVTATLQDGASYASSSFSNTKQAPRATATLSGDQAISRGETATLQVSFTGQSPWSITYNDGSDSYTVNNISSLRHNIKVSPSKTTTYTLTSAADKQGKIMPYGTATVVVNDATLVEQDKADAIRLYPNPASQLLYLDNQGVCVHQIDFYNMLGVSLLRVKSPSNTIDISSLNRGLYFVVLTDVNKNVLQTKTIIVE